MPKSETIGRQVAKLQTVFTAIYILDALTKDLGDYDVREFLNQEVYVQIHNEDGRNFILVDPHALNDVKEQLDGAEIRYTLD